ncbi:MAG: hypothetical protein M3N68_02140 [Actinomycetota bacterium]|nr:hypothetical protein [Actinomycetota bacterium]
MDLSKVLGEFYDEEEEGRDELASALADAVAERGPGSDASGTEPELERMASPPASERPAAPVDADPEPEVSAGADDEPSAGARPAGATWPASGVLADDVLADDVLADGYAAGPALSAPDDPSPLVAELAEAEPAWGEPPPLWHRGDDDVLPHRRRGRRLRLGRGGGR